MNSWFSKVVSVHWDKPPSAYYTVLIVPTGRESKAEEANIHKVIHLSLTLTLTLTIVFTPFHIINHTTLSL